MKAFMDKDFLLSTDTAKKLFHEIAEPMPVLDYHCHINPREIAEDRKFENITQVWLGGDHTNGVRCVPTVWTSIISQGMLRTGKNSRNGRKLWNWLWEILCITGAIWSCSVSSDIMGF